MSENLIILYSKHLKMKKITLLAIAFIAVSLASCSKAKTCTCTSSDGSVSTTNVTSYDKIGSSTANIACPKTRSNTSVSASGVSKTILETCTLS